jgi:hypothetical protein
MRHPKKVANNAKTLKRVLMPICAATAMSLSLSFTPAQAGFVTTVFGPAQWQASDATLGISGYTIENFEDATLASGLQIARLNGAAGNFGPTSTLPATSVFDPTTDTDLGDTSLQAFLRGRWDGSHVLVNHPGPPFTFWYGDAGNWKDLQFSFAPGTTSVGFSLQQMELRNNRLIVNGVTIASDLLGLLGTPESETQGNFTFNSRNGYIRIDATGNDTIQTITLDNDSGDGYAIDHLAFLTVQDNSVPEPGSLGLLGLGLALLAQRARRSRA